MTRTAGSRGILTHGAIREAGLRLIHRHGFEAMSLRQLADAVGLRPGSLYNHIASKQDLLDGLIREHLQDLIERTDAALAGTGPDPVERLRAFAAHHLRYHMERRPEVYVANFELRALTPPNRRAAVALRRRYEDRLVAILEDGAAAGLVHARDARVTAYGLLALLTGVCTWYRPGGRLTAAEIVQTQLDLVLRGCLPAAPEAPPVVAIPALPPAAPLADAAAAE